MKNENGSPISFFCGKEKRKTKIKFVFHFPNNWKSVGTKVHGFYCPKLLVQVVIDRVSLSNFCLTNSQTALPPESTKTDSRFSNANSLIFKSNRKPNEKTRTSTFYRSTCLNNTLWLSDCILFIQIDLCMSLYDGNRISCNHKDIDSIHLLVEIRVKPGYFFVDIKVGESSFLCFKFWVQQVLVCSVQTYKGLASDYQLSWKCLEGHET